MSFAKVPPSFLLQKWRKMITIKGILYTTGRQEFNKVQLISIFTMAFQTGHFIVLAPTTGLLKFIGIFGLI